MPDIMTAEQHFDFCAESIARRLNAPIKTCRAWMKAKDVRWIGGITAHFPGLGGAELTSSISDDISAWLERLDNPKAKSLEFQRQQLRSARWRANLRLHRTTRHHGHTCRAAKVACSSYNEACDNLGKFEHGLRMKKIQADRRAALIKSRAAKPHKPKVPQEFDLSQLSLWSDARKQQDLF